jgi:dGTPase
MNWQQLLSPVRVRELAGGPPSHRSPNEFRSEFERDYGRLVFSTPVRRLHDKTQVFPLEPHDSVRTRLSHSIEVSSVARHLAHELGLWLSTTYPNDFTSENVRHLESIAATCALAHDIGNPPFGHSGELSIQEWFSNLTKRPADKLSLAHAERSDFQLFEGNAQTIRLLTRLQVLSDQFGLNVTSATLASSIKYCAPSDRILRDRHDRKKPGFFQSEAELVGLVRQHVGIAEARHPIAFIVEAADDSVYAFVDIEDAVRKGVINVGDFVQHLGKGDPVIDKVLNRASSVVNTPRRLHDQVAWAEAFRTAAIAEAATSSARVFKERYDQVISGNYHEELVLDPLSSAAPLVEKSKQFARSDVYTWPPVLTLELLGRRVISELMDILWASVKDWPFRGEERGFSARTYQLISHNYRSVFELSMERDTHLSNDYKRLQLVTDYVSGMTDHYACTLLSRLTETK